MIAISSVLIATLGMLFLFSKPNPVNHRNPKGIIALGGVSVAAMAAYLSTQVDPRLRSLFWMLAAAVAVKTYYNVIDAGKDKE